MVLDDKPANQRVTLSTVTIDKLNELGGEGKAYDDIIQGLCQKEIDNKNTARDKQAQKQEFKDEQSGKQLDKKEEKKK